MTRNLSRLPTSSRFSAPDDHPDLEDLVTYLDKVERQGPFRVLLAEADDRLDVRPGDTVLDLGCGLGRAAREAARRAGPTGRVVGVDISRALLRIAEARSDAASPVEYFHGDAAALPLPDAGFDRLRAERLLMHVADPAAVLAEIVRVLRPSGRAVLIEPDWRTLRIRHADQVAASVIQSLFTTRITHPAVGADLSRLCEAAGLILEAEKAHIWSTSALAEVDLTLQLDRVADMAVREGLHPGPAEILTGSLRTGPIAASLTITCVSAIKRGRGAPL